MSMILLYEVSYHTILYTTNTVGTVMCLTAGAFYSNRNGRMEEHTEVELGAFFCYFKQ